MKRLDKTVESVPMWLASLAILLTTASTSLMGQAQEQTAPASAPTNASVGQVTKGFSMPQYQDGKLSAVIAGAEARFISINRTEIKDLKVDLYEGDTISTTITSPRSDYWKEESKMLSRYGVVIKRGDMTITADMMDWNIKDQNGTLSKNVKVVLTSFDMAQPATHPDAAATAPLVPPSFPPDTSTGGDTGSFLLQPQNP